jgi:transcriptional regulator with XRE-family HTH domain
VDAARVVREARGRAGYTQRDLARAAGMLQPAVARIETGDVVPRVDTLARLLDVCGASLVVQPRLRDTEESAAARAEIQALLRASPRQRLLSLPRKAGSPFRPIESIRILAGWRVRFVLVGEIAARSHGAPVAPGVLDIAVQPDRLNAERLARALEALTRGQGRGGSGIPAGLRELRGRGQLRTRFGTIRHWWPSQETYRRLEGAAREMLLAARPVLVASIDDVIERWPRRGRELELLAVLREEMDLRAVRSPRQQRRPARPTSQR